MSLTNFLTVKVVVSNAQNGSDDERIKREEHFYNTAGNIFQMHGAVFDRTPNFRNVLGIRKLTPLNKDKPRGTFDDYIWVLWIGADKIKHATQYEANTEPNWYYQNQKKIKLGGEGRDANGDGKNDLGRLPTGIYLYNTNLESHPVLEKIFRPKQERRLNRDINRDGHFNEADEKLIKDESKMFDQSTIYFHRGSRLKQAEDTWSAGCQTFKFEDFGRFVAEIAAGRKAGQPTFTYLLINE